MKRFQMIVAVVALVGLTSTATAQQQRGGRFGFGRGMSSAGLVMNEAVQKELNITSEQRASLREKMESLRGDLGDFQNLSREDRQKRFEELAKKSDEAIKSVLDEKQQKRLKELQLQAEGAGALTDPEIAMQLKLDEAQKEKIKKIQEENNPRFDFQNSTQEERQKYFAEARERREKMNKEILAVLTPDQKEQFEKMQGEKFEFPERGRNRNQN